MTFYLLFLHWMVSWNSKCLSFSFLKFSRGMQSVRKACQNKKYSYRFSSFNTINNSFIDFVSILLGFPVGSAGKESGCNVEDLGSIPGLERSPGKGKGYPLQCSGLENSMDCIVHGVAKSRIRLSNFHFHLYSWIVYLYY